MVEGAYDAADAGRHGGEALEAYAGASLEEPRPGLARHIERAVLQHLAPPHAVVDRNFDILHFSSSVPAHLPGADPATRSNLLDLLTGTARIELRALAEQVMSSQRAASRKRVRLDGDDAAGALDLTVHPLLVAEHHEPLLLVVVQRSAPLESDRSVEQELDRHQKLLRESQERLRLTLERAPVVLCTTDKDLRYVWKAGGERRLPFVEVQGRTDHDLLPRVPAQELMRVKREVLATGCPQHVEMKLEGADGTSRIWEFVIEVARGEDGAATGVLMAGLDITERRRSEEHKQFLLAELNHRVKNTLASIRSMIMRTLSQANSTPQLREALDGRLQVLARTHDLLVGSHWQGVPLHDLVEGEVARWRNGDPERVQVEGPHAILAPSAVPMMAMAVHELVTNAARHGALSDEAGRVTILWDIEPRSDGQDLLRIRWEERDGPPVTEPERAGFGRQLIESGVAYELGGTVESRFAPKGYAWEARLLARRCLKPFA